VDATVLGYCPVAGFCNSGYEHSWVTSYWSQSVEEYCITSKR